MTQSCIKPDSSQQEDPLWLLTAPQRLQCWNQGETTGPWKLLIFPTYRCNITCGICVRDYWERNPILWKELPDERWLEIIDEAQELGVQRLTIGGGGEPTVRGDLVRKLCMRAKAHGMEGFLQTNGTRLTPELIETLIDTRWDHVTISLDGPDADTNDKIRSEGNFDTVAKALIALKEARQQKNSSYPQIALHTIITSVNYQRLPEMIDFALVHGVDVLAASPLLEAGMEDTDYILTAEQKSEVPSIIEQCIAKAEAANLTHFLDGLTELYAGSGTDRSVDRMEQPSRVYPVPLMQAPCLEPWGGMTIVSSGHVSPCCYFWEEKDNSVRHQSLRDIWFGPYFNSFREKMLSSDIPLFCKTCHYPDTQEHLHYQQRFKDLCAERTQAQLKLGQIPTKIFENLRHHGIKGSLRRFKEWLSIRRKVRYSR